jgi:hypothetical protein
LACLIAGAIFTPILRWFFIGFYPGSLRSGDPGYDTTMRYSLDLVWGGLNAILDLGLCCLGWKLRSVSIIATPIALLVLSFIVSIARFVAEISGNG